MSVPTYKRSQSSIQYLEELFQFNIRLGEICMNCPKKYRMNYADKTIQNGLDALKYAQLANGIYIGSGASDEAFKQREEYLRLSIGLIEHIATACFIFLEQAKKYGGLSYDKAIRQEEYIGQKTTEIKNLLLGVIKSDKQRHK